MGGFYQQLRSRRELVTTILHCVGNVGFQSLGSNEIRQHMRSGHLKPVGRSGGVSQDGEGLHAVFGHCCSQPELREEPVFALVVNEDVDLGFSVLETAGAVGTEHWVEKRLGLDVKIRF